ncbi:MAG: hypothetical protein MSIBF_02660 [Candidatus Altiarchaeales archaeon IMC4]|nr:MAG: hypothetical protein MSIBF_02660 [Candidatus Altiarchaeales archaeon IMC4]
MELFAVIKVASLVAAAVLVPGFFLSLGIFPKKTDIDITERIGISFFFGMIPYLLLYFANKNFFTAINAGSVLAMMLAVSVLGFVLWQARKEK